MQSPRTKPADVRKNAIQRQKVERWTEAPQQTQQSQQPNTSTYDAGTSAQRTAEEVVDVPVTTDAGAGVQRTVEQIIAVPDVEELAQQRPVEQVVSVATETTVEATPTLDRAELDVTQQVPPRVQAKAASKAAAQYECSLARSIRLECASVSAARSKLNVASSAPESARQNASDKLCKTGFLSKQRPQRAVTDTAPAPVIEYVAPVYAVYAATAPVNEYVASARLICRRGCRSRSAVSGSYERGSTIWSTHAELFGDRLRWSAV